MVRIGFRVACLQAPSVDRDRAVDAGEQKLAMVRRRIFRFGGAGDQFLGNQPKFGEQLCECGRGFWRLCSKRRL